MVSPDIRLIWNDPTTGERNEQNVALPATIGRTSENTIVPNSSQISRVHARIERDGNTIVVLDQNSTNGVIVAEQRVKRAVLNDGDSFQVGPFTFVVDLPQVVQQSAPTVLAGQTSQAGTSSQVVVRWQNPDSKQLHEKTTDLPITFGRDDDNTIVLPSPKVSRRHATIERKDDTLWLIDAGSRNGTLLNGQPITRAMLRPGDPVAIGDFILYVDLVASDATVIAQPDNAATVLGAPHDSAATSLEPAIKITSSLQASLIFSEDTNTLLPLTPPPPAAATVEFPPAAFREQRVSMEALRRTGVPIEETTYLALGGGLGSFVWVDHLVIYGANPRDIVVIGLEPKPHGRYERLCTNSQIPLHERLRSNSDSCPDNIWGWPGYAVRETWDSLRKGQIGNAARVTWQIFGEPTLAQTYTPRSGDVYHSIDCEAQRIGWNRMWRYGRIKAIRQTDDGRYVVAYSQTGKDHGSAHKLIVAQYAHLAVGYPGVRFLPDLQEYREQTLDFKGVVNAYEQHKHVYDQLRNRGGIVLIRGRGIVASRIMQRLTETRAHNPNIAILHLLRSPLARGSRYKWSRRKVEHHWEFQPFNWPKATWGGQLRRVLEHANDKERDELLNDWGGTTTADRKDWRQMVARGVKEGWYQIRFGDVLRVERNGDKLVTVIRGKGAIKEEAHIVADYIIDCTGLEARVETNPLLKDLVEHYQLERNPKDRLKVANDFEVPGMRNGNARFYAAGAMTLGGPYAAVDSFLGLQFAAQRSADALAAVRAPGVRKLNGLRSVRQWMRWARGVQP